MYNDFNGDGFYGYNNMSTQGAGMYTPGTQFNFDPIMLQSLGFDQNMINVLQFIIMNDGKVTPMSLSQYGIPYEQARDIKYMYDIVTGRVVINSEVDLIKHLKRMFGKDKKIGINDLALSRITEVPRMAVVAGINVKPFTIYNSKQYPPTDRLYKVVDVSSTRITVETTRKPKLEWKADKKIEGLLEIKEVKGKVVTIAFDKRVCKLCNRFIIVASLKRPEFHHGLAEIICLEGTKVYVYAQTLKPKDTIKYNYGTQRVYDFGYLRPEINQKLTNAAANLYPIVCGVVGNRYPANMDFITVPIDEPKEEESVFDEDL